VTELRVSGMTCASCVAHVNRALRKVPGVVDASVNLATERASVRHEGSVDPSQLLAAVEGAGYHAALVRDRPDDEDANARDAEIRRKRTLLIAAFALFIPTLVLGMTPLRVPGKEWVLLALTFPVWLVVGWEFHRGALAALRTGIATMDTLVSLGSTAAFGYSIYATVSGQDAYYETAGAIVTLVFAGKYLEAAARGRSNRAIRALLDLRPPVALRREPDGSTASIGVDAVQVDDVLIVAAGERIPIDGVVIEGASSIDASMLTGEPIPVGAGPGDAVKQGTLNGDGTLVIRAVATGSGTTLARIVEAVRRAQGSTPPVQRVADAAAAVFVPAILAVSALTAGGWMLAHHPFGEAFRAAVAVLVVACPCALGLATPTAIMVSAGVGARRGLLFRDASAIERLARVKAVLFDKTGTMTIGKPEIVSIAPVNGIAEHAVLQTAAALERGSTHPLAHAIVAAAAARDLPVDVAASITASAGGGLAGALGNEPVLIGNDTFLRERGVDVDGAIASRNATRVYVAKSGRVLGAIDFGDPVRPQSAEAVERLHRDGVAVYLVSGDAQAPTAALAGALHADGAYWRVSPEDKANIVAQLRERYGSVAFAGDGINDAPALAAADVGLAMGAGTEIAIETAQAAILSNDPRAVATGIELSRATLRTINQNLFWAFAYNAVLVPLAVVGIVHPVLAAAAMGFSSVFVVTNSLRLSKAGLGATFRNR
jgi:Cu+-exporting ATPase